MSSRRIPLVFTEMSRHMAIVRAVRSRRPGRGMFVNPQRAWADLLLASFALTCLGLAGLVFVAIQYASGAVWSIALRRVGEAMTSVLPFGAVGVFIVLLARPSLYPWYGHHEVVEGWAGFRDAWFSYPFFLTRSVVYFAVWIGFAKTMLRNSAEQDHSRGAEMSRRNTRLSVGFLIAFAITFWLAATDWVMTLEPEWVSTIFGVYQFLRYVYGRSRRDCAATIALRKYGPWTMAFTTIICTIWGGCCWLLDVLDVHLVQPVHADLVTRIYRRRPATISCAPAPDGAGSSSSHFS